MPAKFAMGVQASIMGRKKFRVVEFHICHVFILTSESPVIGFNFLHIHSGYTSFLSGLFHANKLNFTAFLITSDTVFQNSVNPFIL